MGILRLIPAVFLLTSADGSFKVPLEQLSVVVVIGNSHPQHIKKRPDGIRSFNHQLEPAHHLFGVSQSINLPHEERDSLLGYRTGVNLV